MTNELFWNLYNNNKINVKSFAFRKDNKDIEISAFEYDGKYYLRIVSDSDPYILDRRAECGKKYRMRSHNCFFKEFTNKNSANKYFAAVKKGN